VRKQTVCKFVTERFQFVGVGDALKLLNDNTDFTVIAVLGLAGAGKSAILNDLATMTASWGGAGGGGLDRGLPRKPFAVQTEDILLDASHQTVGVDMHVTDERLILLDCQPLLSAYVVLKAPPPP
jgi:protein SMG9